MPSTQVERYITIVYEEDYVKFASKVSHLLKYGWKHISSGCNSVPIADKKNTIIRVIYWMIMMKMERIPIPH